MLIESKLTQKLNQSTPAERKKWLKELRKKENQLERMLQEKDAFSEHKFYF